VLVMPEGEREELLGRIRAYLASRPEVGVGPQPAGNDITETWQTWVEFWVDAVMWRFR
jgi:hypothetical protein